ncbi:trypsin-5-like [Ctenocephalides felis]|uniref:trypsin-5-like n=1 Tax=Ctenocephalides felis TaxID=7515 RepID=UPI000E6E1F21|nr:trypsin-5-like [Ctenocephalides felis]
MYLLIITTIAIINVPNAQCLLLDILDGRVVGGEKARIAEFPHQISLRYNKKHTCGGSIIDAYYILTAAHCVYGRNRPKKFTVVAGSSFLYKGGNHHEVESIVYPKRYTPRSLNHDVAVIKLKKAIVFGKYQQPIALTMRDTPKGLMAKFSGWGLMSTKMSIV